MCCGTPRRWTRTAACIRPICGRRKATDHYILKGEGTEVWEPRFTYHGFRYVEVTGYPGEPTLATLEGRVVHDDMTRIADFSTSNTLLTQIHQNMFWGIRGNYRSIPTDCPQRDERQGWLGDRSMVSRSEIVHVRHGGVLHQVGDRSSPTPSAQTAASRMWRPNYWQIYTDNVTWPAPSSSCRGCCTSNTATAARSSAIIPR